MHGRDLSVRQTADLIHRAAATSLNSARIIARSIELITRSLTIAQAAARCQIRASEVQVASLRARTQFPRRAARPRLVRHSDRVDPLPLTPPRLLELAEEFRDLARKAETPESRAAFEHLVFRYTALAAGYDDTQVGSRMLH
jgi:hypothetical protein